VKTEAGQFPSLVLMVVSRRGIGTLLKQLTVTTATHTRF
jgi:hypothetical protein